MARRAPKDLPDQPAGWLETFMVHRPYLKRVVARFVKPHEIEDIVQETFVRSYAAARKQTIHSPRSFLVTTARNIALNAAGRAVNRLHESVDDLLETDALEQTLTPESIYDSQQEFLAFCQAVAELPVACRRVFILKKVYGLSLKETAEYLQISASTVENHITKGMMMTAQYMLDRGYSMARHRRNRKDVGSEAGDAKDA